MSNIMSQSSAAGKILSILHAKGVARSPSPSQSKAHMYHVRCPPQICTKYTNRDHTWICHMSSAKKPTTYKCPTKVIFFRVCTVPSISVHDELRSISIKSCWGTPGRKIQRPRHWDQVLILFLAERAVWTPVCAWSYIAYHVVGWTSACTAKCPFSDMIWLAFTLRQGRRCWWIYTAISSVWQTDASESLGFLALPLLLLRLNKGMDRV